MAEFFSMGGYGAYVWPSYGMTAIIMVVLLIVSVRGLKSTQATFDRLKAETGSIRDHKKKTEETPDGDEA